MTSLVAHSFYIRGALVIAMTAVNCITTGGLKLLDGVAAYVQFPTIRELLWELKLTSLTLGLAVARFRDTVLTLAWVAVTLAIYPLCRICDVIAPCKRAMRGRCHVPLAYNWTQTSDRAKCNVACCPRTRRPASRRRIYGARVMCSLFNDGVRPVLIPEPGRGNRQSPSPGRFIPRSARFMRCSLIKMTWFQCLTHQSAPLPMSNLQYEFGEWRHETPAEFRPSFMRKTGFGRLGNPNRGPRLPLSLRLRSSNCIPRVGAIASPASGAGRD